LSISVMTLENKLLKKREGITFLTNIKLNLFTIL
jgi:hypothetical protein